MGAPTVRRRTQPLDRLLDEECRAAVAWATQDGPGWAVAMPEPIRCVHGHWESVADGMPQPRRATGSGTTLTLWHGPTGWHLTVVGARGAIVTGSIMTDGVLGKVVPHFLPPATLGIAPTANGLRFRIKLGEGTVGFDFRVGCGSHLITTAFADGHRLDSSAVLIGADECHPDSVPFQISRVIQGRIFPRQSERR